jgi:hypothetical protein
VGDRPFAQLDFSTNFAMALGGAVREAQAEAGSSGVAR